MPRCLVTKLVANRATIPTTRLVEITSSIHIIIVPFHSIHVPLQLFLPPPSLTDLPQF